LCDIVYHLLRDLFISVDISLHHRRNQDSDFCQRHQAAVQAEATIGRGEFKSRGEAVRHIDYRSRPDRMALANEQYLLFRDRTSKDPPNGSSTLRNFARLIETLKVIGAADEGGEIGTALWFASLLRCKHRLPIRLMSKGGTKTSNSQAWNTALMMIGEGISGSPFCLWLHRVEAADAHRTRRARKPRPAASFLSCAAMVDISKVGSRIFGAVASRDQFCRYM
jgi:hypothetical protein